MSSSPKIVVLKTREILYTLILLFLVILLIVCLFLMFAPKKADSGQSQSVTSAATYIPGIYTAPVTLGKDTMNMEVTVDASEIRAIRLVNLSEAITASYPLVSQSMEEIEDQILETQSLDGISCPLHRTAAALGNLRSACDGGSIKYRN